MTPQADQKERWNEPKSRQGPDLRAVCFGCGLERPDDPLIVGKGLSVCLVCGETRMVVDQRADGDWRRRDA
jgi:hypothetical protein